MPLQSTWREKSLWEHINKSKFLVTTALFVKFESKSFYPNMYSFISFFINSISFMFRYILFTIKPVVETCLSIVPFSKHSRGAH